MTIVKFKAKNCLGRSALMAYHSNKMAKRETNYARDFLILPCYELKLQHDPSKVQSQKLCGKKCINGIPF
jgi:hypothetical protein